MIIFFLFTYPTVAVTIDYHQLYMHFVIYLFGAAFFLKFFLFKSLFFLSCLVPNYQMVYLIVRMADSWQKSLVQVATRGEEKVGIVFMM